MLITSIRDHCSIISIIWMMGIIFYKIINSQCFYLNGIDGLLNIVLNCFPKTSEKESIFIGLILKDSSESISFAKMST